MERGRAMPRGRRGRGRGRGRARTPVADGGSRGEASKAGLANNARELAEAGQEDASGEAHDWVEVPVVWRQPRGAAASDDAARMKQLVEDPKEKTAAADDAAARMKQAVENPAPAAPFDPGMVEFEYINVGGCAMERDAYVFIRYDLGMPQRDESVAGEGHASGEVQGMRRQPRCSDDDDDDDAAWMKQLVEDLKEKPQRDESVAENFLAGQEDASGEMPVVWRQPRGAAAADDAARMKQLAEDPKEKTAAADDAAARMKQPVEKPVPAAPFDPGMIEHINVGRHVMERDAYDFIRYDLGIPPPSLEPEPPEPGHDEPLRLWSSDDSSFPQSAPPPPPPK